MALCVEAKAHLNSKFVWLVRMREHFTHLIKRFKKRAIEEGRLDYFNTKRNNLNILVEETKIMILVNVCLKVKGFLFVSLK
jgi:hypothetical protein